MTPTRKKQKDFFLSIYQRSATHAWMPRQRRNPSNAMNNRGNETARKQKEKSLENKYKDVEICDLNDR